MSPPHLLGLAGVALLLVGGEIGCRALRLRLVAAAVGHRLSAAAVVRVTLLGDFAAAITPANAGGEPARLLALCRAGLPWSHATLALAAELSTDVAVLLGLVATVAVTIGVPASGRAVWAAAAGLGLALAAGFPLARRALRQTGGRLARTLAELRAGLTTLARRKRILFLALLAAVGHCALRFAVLPALAVGLGVHVELRFLVAWQLVAFYGLAFTPTPGGTGATEAAFLLFFGPIVPRDQLGVLLVAWRLLSYYVYLVVGGLAAVGTARRTRRSGDPSLAWPRGRSG